MDRIYPLLEWAAPKGVEIRGIQPQARPNCGIGMMATKTLQKGDVLVTVPIRAMRGLETVPATIRAKLPSEMSIHGLLAAEFVLSPLPKSWRSVIPTTAEFNSIPFFWPQAAQDLLPGAAKRLLNKQQSSIRRDWEQLQRAYPDVVSEDYAHAWFVVSTRAFYQETQQTLRYPWHDRLALLPVADLFNHAATGCKACYCTDSYDIIADREYVKGEEVCTSYGDHSNDFLLAEYGFLLQNNIHDRFDPEDLVSSESTAEEAEVLKRLKTLPALQQICGPPTGEDAIPDGNGLAETASGAVDTVQLRELLAKILSQIKERRRAVLGLGEGDGNQGYQAILLQRWDQIDELVREAIQLSTMFIYSCIEFRRRHGIYLGQGSESMVDGFWSGSCRQGLWLTRLKSFGA